MSQDISLLYIDDELDLLEIASSFFEDAGLIIDTCSSLTMAQKMVNSHHYHVIVSDIWLPDGNGNHFIQELRAAGRFGGKFVAVTGDVASADLSGAGADLIIYKPLNFEDMVADVLALLSMELK